MPKNIKALRLRPATKKPSRKRDNFDLVVSWFVKLKFFTSLKFELLTTFLKFVSDTPILILKVDLDLLNDLAGISKKTLPPDILDYIEKNPEIIKKWINANEKTVQWINNHPDESKKLYNEFLKSYMGRTLPGNIVEKSFSNIIITSEPLENSVYTFAERADVLGYLGRDG